MMPGVNSTSFSGATLDAGGGDGLAPHLLSQFDVRYLPEKSGMHNRCWESQLNVKTVQLLSQSDVLYWPFPPCAGVHWLDSLSQLYVVLL